MSDDKNESPYKMEARPAAKKTVEEWATQKGLLPEMLKPGKAKLGQHIVPAPRPNPRFVEFAQAKRASGWAVGTEVTEEEFDSAVKEAQGTKIR